MNPMQLLLRFWQHPRASEVDINSDAMVSIHREVIQQKPYLRFIYRRWYGQFLAIYNKIKNQGLPLLELGSGAGHLEKYIPEIIKSDVFAHPNVHQVIHADNLPFADQSVGAIFILNAFHHFPDVARFLSEAQRVLVPGGYLVLTEPSGSPLQKFMVQKFHPHEYYDDTPFDWDNSPQGRLGSCNNALPYMVFERDQKKLLEKFPQFKILSLKKHTYFSYFVSGGLSYRSFLPAFFIPLVALSESLLEVLFPSWGTEMTVTLQKKI